MATAEVLECDVLVVGGGGAACMAAISAEGQGARVLLVDKGQLGKSGCSPNAHGGVAASHKHEQDDWKVHLHDTLLSGGFLNKQELAGIICRGAGGLIPQLEQFGCLFNRDEDGSYSVRNFGGHAYPRSVFCGDETGHEMMIGLRREILRRRIQHLDEVMVTRLVTDGGSVTGAVCWDIAGGGFYYVKAPTTILATGDAAGIWPSASERQRGDGIAVALEAGAELVDMEFIQYHPTHAWSPFGVRGSVSESFRAEGGHLLNSLNERFMEKYDPKQMELATRDKISVCIYREILEGRGAPNGGIYASVTHLSPSRIETWLPVILHKYLQFGIDVRKEVIEVRPQPHYLNGGVSISDQARTSLPGLYAAGAVTGGVHGANRLGSNSLTDILVFGEIAGENAAREALTSQRPVRDRRDVVDGEIGRIAGLCEGNEPDVSLPRLRRRHIEMMDRHVGVLRQEKGLRTTLEEIEQAQNAELPNLSVSDGAASYNFELRDALEMFYRLQIEEVCTRAALLRQESRGCHFREDFPQRDDHQWLKNIVFSKTGGDLRYEIRDVEQPLQRLEQFAEYAASNSPWH